MKTKKFDARLSFEYFSDLEAGPKWDAEWNALSEWQRAAIDAVFLDEELARKNHDDYCSVAG